MTHAANADRDTRGAVVFSDGTLPESATSSLEALTHRSRHLVLRCQSGRRIEGDWTGVPLRELLATVDAPDATTHLLVESADGYRACVPVRDAMDALLAFEEDRIDREASVGVTPRLVGPRIDTPRAVKRIDRIQGIEVGPDEDPADFEYLPD